MNCYRCEKHIPEPTPNAADNPYRYPYQREVLVDVPRRVVFCSPQCIDLYSDEHPNCLLPET